MNAPTENHPPCRVTSTVFSDFEEMEAALCAADVKLSQSKPGKFQGGLATAALEQAVLCVGWESVGHLTRAAAQPGFILNLGAEDQFLCNGHPLHDGTMLACRSGAELMAYSTGNIRWAYLILPPDRMEQTLAGVADGGALDTNGSCLSFRLAPATLQRLRGTVCRALSVLTATPRILDDPRARTAMEQSLLEAFQEPMSNGGLRPGTDTAHAHACAVRRAREYLCEHLHQPIYMSDVRDAAKVSERTLRNAFQTLFGMSPNRYLKMLRMNAARRELRRANPEQCTVRKVARGLGFWDMSRFAVEYKELFGESPSQTAGERRSGGRLETTGLDDVRQVK